MGPVAWGQYRIKARTIESQSQVGTLSAPNTMRPIYIYACGAWEGHCSDRPNASGDDCKLGAKNVQHKILSPCFLAPELSPQLCDCSKKGARWKAFLAFQ